MRAKPNARKARVEVRDGGQLLVQVDAPAVEGKANGRLLEILAEHFRVARSRIRIIRGKTSRIKVVEVS